MQKNIKLYGFLTGSNVSHKWKIHPNQNTEKSNYGARIRWLFY